MAFVLSFYVQKNEVVATCISHGNFLDMFSSNSTIEQ